VRLLQAVGAPEGAADDMAARTAGVADLIPGITPEHVTDHLLTELIRSAI
jgi:hypothetical protein